MLELTEQNAAEILHARGHLASATGVRVRELSGGVSNAVFLVESPTERFCLKQARGKLRVQADWQCSVERIWREVEVLRACQDLVKSGEDGKIRVPRIRWQDPELYAYAMTAAEAQFNSWKDDLLSGRLRHTHPYSAGLLLRAIHAGSWHSPELAERFKDRTYFAQLRLEPYYLAAAENYRPLANQLSDLVDQTWREPHALVHGDFSPKNMLVFGGRLMLIDFEVGHYGDPAFDLGFFLTHLTLKALHLPSQREDLFAIRQAFLVCYGLGMRRALSPADYLALERRSVQHLAGCLIARVHGKSPVDYLTPAEQQRAVALAVKLFDLGPEATWKEAFDLVQGEV